MGVSCSHITDEMFSEIKKKVNTGNLTKVQIEAIYIKLKNMYNCTDEDILNKLLPQFNGAVAEARNKALEDSKKTSTVIGGAQARTYYKNEESNKIKMAGNDNTLYVFLESAQVREAVTGQPTGISEVFELLNGAAKTTYVYKGMASTRWDVNNNPMSNTFGLIIKRNSTTEKGKAKRKASEETTGPKVEIFDGNWTREEVAKQKDKVFLFGDNTDDRTNTHHVPTSTQAVIRGLDNAIGIDTKKNRGTKESSYFTDEDFDEFKTQVDEAIDKAIKSGKTIVIPKDGIGTGRAQLKTRAPKLYEYLNNKLKALRTGMEESQSSEDTELINAFREDVINLRTLLTRGDVKYKEVVFPEVFRVETTKETAQKMADILKDYFGIDAQVLKRSAYSDKYNIEIKINKPESKSDKESDNKSSSKTYNTQKSNKKTKQELQEEGEQSLKTERPTDVEAQIKEEDIDVLVRTFPDSAKRKARVDFLLSRISQYIESIVQDALEQVLSLSEEELDAIYDNGKNNLTFRDIKTALTSGEPHLRKLFALNNLVGGEDNQDLVSYIINSIRDQLKQYSAEDVSVQQLAEEVLLDPDSILGEQFLEEARYKGWGQISISKDDEGNEARKIPNKLRVKAEERAAVLHAEFGKMADDKVFIALLDAAKIDLELTEGIVLGDVFSVGTKEGFVNKELDEENLSIGKMDFVMKYRLRNPYSTLSVKLRSILASITVMEKNRFGDVIPKYDDLGSQIRLNPSYTYYILLSSLSNVTSIEDFNRKLTKMKEKYPFMTQLVTQIQVTPGFELAYDNELMKEVYRSAKFYVQYGYVTEKGFIANLNRTNSSEVLYASVEKAYEGGVLLNSALSIYDNFGGPVENNIRRLRTIISPLSKEDKKDLYGDRLRKKAKYKTPIYWAYSIIKDPSKFSASATQQGNKQDWVEALKILRGEDDRNPNNRISFEDILNAIGIDTTNLDMNALLPAIKEEDLDNYSIDPKTGDLVYNNGESIVISKDQVRRIGVILEAIRGILKEDSFRANTHLLSGNKSRYLLISSSLSLVSTGYTQNSFRFGDTDRQSYTAPNYIDIMTATISEASEEGRDEDAVQYILDNFGKFTFFRRKGEQELCNVWLESMADANSKYSHTLRKHFKAMNLLGMMGRDDAYTVQNASKKDMIFGSIGAYFSANSEDGLNFAYYRNALFSDVDALCYIQQRRLTRTERFDENGNPIQGELGKEFDFKSAIIRQLIKVFKQDLDRVKDVRRSANNNDIEFFNTGEGKKKRGAFLTFFPEFNSGKRTIQYRVGNETFEETIDGIDGLLKFVEQQPGETDYKWDKRVDAFIFGAIEQLMDQRFQRFSYQFTDRDKSTLYSRYIEKKSPEEELQQLNEAQDTEEELQVAYKEGLQEQEESLTKEEKAQQEEKAKMKMVDDLLEEFFYNDLFAQSQMIQILAGDLAYFKNFADFIKRNKECYAGGERLYYKDENGDEIYDRGLYLEDLEQASTTWKDLRKLLDQDKSLDEMEKAAIRGAFLNINTTDGQTLRSLKSFKKILVAMGGKWTDAMEAAYKKITEEHRITAEDFMTLWQPIKPFLFSYEEREVNGRVEKVITQHKNSEYLLSAVYTMLNTALNKSPMLLGLHQFMIDHDIDSIHFHSVVKEGYNNGIDINHDPKRFKAAVKNGKIQVGNVTIDAPSYDKFKKNLAKALNDEKITNEEYNKAIKSLQYQTQQEVYKALQDWTYDKQRQARRGDKLSDRINAKMTHSFPIRDYMIMQPTTDHLIDAEAIFGSQLRNIIYADLTDDFTRVMTIKGVSKTLNKKEAILVYNALLTKVLMNGFRRISKELKTPKDIERMLQAAMDQQPSKFTKDIRDALTIDKSTGMFRVPPNSPLLRNKIEQLILSVFKNNIQKQHIKGGNAVLVSNIGLHNDLHVQYKWVTDPVTGEKVKKVDYIPVLLTHTMASQLKDFLEPSADGRSYFINFEKMKKALGDQADEILKAIGYRIPTEDKYSMFPIRIVGFMPSIAGCTVMMPSDIIELSGTDFDIDKLFFMFKEIRREVYSNDVIDGFIKYLNARKAKGKKISFVAQLKFNNLKKNKTSGFTEEEISSLTSNHQSFDWWLRNFGYKYKYETPKYIVDEPEAFKDEKGELDWKSTIFNASDTELNNMLIDSIYDVLTSPQGSSLMMRQGTFRDVELSASMEKIKKNPDALKAFMDKYGDDVYTAMNKIADGFSQVSDATKFFNDFYDQYASVQSPMDILDWADNHRNLMDGNDLIGRTAVNSSSHYKLQNLDVEITDDHIIRLNGIEIKKVDEAYSSLDGKRIGEICAQFQAAAPDNGKNPCLGYMNVSPSTMKLVALLSRTRVPIRDIGVILNCIDISDLPIDKDAGFIKDFNLNLSDLVKTKIALDSGHYDLIYKRYLNSVIMWMNNLKKVAKDLSVVSPIIKADSPNGALSPNFGDAIQQFFQFRSIEQKINDPEYSLTGIQKIVDFHLDANKYDIDDIEQQRKLFEKFLEAPIPRLQAVFTLGFTSALALVKPVLSDFGDNSFNRLEKFQDETGVSFADTKNAVLVKKILNEYTAFLLSKSELFGSTDKQSIMDKRNYYIHDFPIKFKLITEQKDKNGNYAYPNIATLSSIKRLSNRFDRGIKMDNISKISPELRRDYVEAFNQLLTMDPEKVGEEEADTAKKLAADLLLYSYYENGLTYSYSNFANFFSSVYLRSIPGCIPAYRQADNISRSDDRLDEEFIYQFIMNHPEVATSVKPSAFKKIKNDLRNQDDFIAQKKSDGMVDLRLHKTNSGGFREFVRVRLEDDTVLLRLKEIRDGIPIYSRIKAVPIGLLYYDATKNYTEIEYDKLKEKGNAGIKLSLKEQGEEDSVKDNFNPNGIDDTETSVPNPLDDGSSDEDLDIKDTGNQDDVIDITDNGSDDGVLDITDVGNTDGEIKFNPQGLEDDVNLNPAGLEEEGFNPVGLESDATPADLNDLEDSNDKNGLCPPK